METKKCQYCGTEIKGRRDKKFCDDQCRNAMYNQNHCNEIEVMRSIHNILRRNRKILANLLTNGHQKEKVDRYLLLHDGFVFNYFTHVQLQKNGHAIKFCYEYGYCELNDEVVLVVYQPLSKAA
jgi:predicted nucleic acid-binding Zn ribbon protein